MTKPGAILTALVFYFLLQITECNQACPGDRSRLEPGRICKKPCTSDANCRGALKRCRCDSLCGMTCFNPDLICDPLEAFENGDILGRRGHGETVTYRCNFGYHLDGDSRRTCWADKKWTGRAPRCRRGCRPPRPTDTGYANSFDNFYEVGAVVNYVCRIGYIISGDAQSRCQENGWWSELQFRCRIIVCDEPPLVANSRRNGTSFEFGRRVRYICNRGYELASESDWLLCDTTGEWFGTVPRCDPVSCLAPQNPVNGRVITNGVQFTYGNRVRYSCSRQFKLVGPSESTCNTDRNWSPAPTCEVDIDCNFQDTSRATCGWLNNGVVWDQVIHGADVYYHARFSRGNVGTTSKSILISPFVSASSNQCFKFHYRLVQISSSFDFVVNIIDGNSRSQIWSCNESDELNAWLNTDIAILPRQTNYQIEIVVAKSTVSSIQIDIDNLEVTENGNCQNECEPVSPCLNGGQCLNRIGSFKCICPAGYRGLTCSQEITCLPPAAPVGGSVSPGGRIRIGNSVTYSCSAGYILQGESRRTCTSENNWSHIAPLCLRQECNERVIEFGSTVPSNRPTFQPGETVQFSCNSGYSLSGASHDTCSHTTGDWNNPAPTCIRIVPGYTRCPPGYLYRSPYCYKVYTDEQTYADATTICQRDGAHLPIIITNEMLIMVKAINSNTWLGLDDINQEGIIKWSNGVLMAPEFGNVRNSNTDHRDCALMYRNWRWAWAFSMYECNTRHRFVCMKYEALATPVQLTIHEPNSLTFLSGVYEPEEGRIQRGTPIYKARNGATFKATGELPGGEARYWNVMDSRNIQQIVILTTAKYPQEVAITNIRYWVSGQPGTQQLPPGRRVRMEIISYLKWRPWAQWSSCGATCGEAFQIRRRICDGSTPGTVSCPYPEIEHRNCNLAVCVENFCDPNPCQHSGNCVNSQEGFTCDCTAGYRGTRCETESGPCDPNPCQHGGTCAHINARQYRCLCPGNREGDRCQTAVNPCQSNPCLNGGTCTPEAESYRCSCTTLYSGNNCQTMKTCSLPNNVAGLKEAGGNSLQQTYNAQSRVRFACIDVNQVLQGNYFSNCLVTQNWDRPFPTCVQPAGFCPNLQAPANGGISLSKRINIPGTIATFNCDNGYNRVGPRRLLCQSSYQWSDTAPTCQIQGCTIFVPPNGIIVPAGIEHAVGATVEVQCPEFQTLSGSPTTITCLGQDRWSHDLNGYSCT